MIPIIVGLIETAILITIVGLTVLYVTKLTEISFEDEPLFMLTEDDIP